MNNQLCYNRSDLVPEFRVGELYLDDLYFTFATVIKGIEFKLCLSQIKQHHFGVLGSCNR